MMRMTFWTLFFAASCCSPREETNDVELAPKFHIFSNADVMVGLTKHPTRPLVDPGGEAPHQGYIYDFKFFENDFYPRIKSISRFYKYPSNVLPKLLYYGKQDDIYLISSQLISQKQKAQNHEFNLQNTDNFSAEKGLYARNKELQPHHAFVSFIPNPLVATRRDSYSRHMFLYEFSTIGSIEFFHLLCMLHNLVYAIKYTVQLVIANLVFNQLSHIIIAYAINQITNYNSSSNNYNDHRQVDENQQSSTNTSETMDSTTNNHRTIHTIPGDPDDPEDPRKNKIIWDIFSEVQSDSDNEEEEDSDDDTFDPTQYEEEESDDDTFDPTQYEEEESDDDTFDPTQYEEEDSDDDTFDPTQYEEEESNDESSDRRKYLIDDTTLMS